MQAASRFLLPKTAGKSALTLAKRGNCMAVFLPKRGRVNNFLRAVT
jgi:hypothetical protein